MHNLLNKSSNRNGYRLEEIGRKIIAGRERGEKSWSWRGTMASTVPGTPSDKEKPAPPSNARNLANPLTQRGPEPVLNVTSVAKNVIKIPFNDAGREREREHR